MTHVGEHNGHRATDPAAIERDIIRQRAELAHTIELLSHKLDVKHRAEESVHDAAARLRDLATTDEGRPRPDLLAAGAAVVAGIALLLWWRAHP